MSSARRKRANSVAARTLEIITKHSPKFLTCAELRRMLLEYHLHVTDGTISGTVYRMYNNGRLIRKRVGPSNGYGYTLSPDAWLFNQRKKRRGVAQFG